MEIHKLLGKGHSEIIYKEAAEYEFQQQNIPYKGEQNILSSIKLLLNLKQLRPLLQAILSKP